MPPLIFSHSSRCASNVDLCKVLTAVAVRGLYSANTYTVPPLRSYPPRLSPLRLRERKIMIYVKLENRTRAIIRLYVEWTQRKPILIPTISKIFISSQSQIYALKNIIPSLLYPWDQSGYRKSLPEAPGWIVDRCCKDISQTLYIVLV